MRLFPLLLAASLLSSTAHARAPAPAERAARWWQDVSTLATHAHGPDYDVVMDRHARGLLGLGAEPGDPGTRLT